MTELDIDSDIVRGYVAAARLWWLFLLIGAAWLLFAIVVFRFSYTSVSAISILFGVVVLVAGIDELFIAFAGGEGGWMKVARLLLALALIVIGILAFVHPGDTFQGARRRAKVSPITKARMPITMKASASNRRATFISGLPANAMKSSSIPAAGTTTPKRIEIAETFV